MYIVNSVRVFLAIQGPVAILSQFCKIYLITKHEGKYEPI